METIDSLACLSRWGMLESSAALLSASAVRERARVGWLNFFSKRAKGMSKGWHRIKPLAAGMVSKLGPLTRNR
jgi:hypothetical protein